MPARARPLLRPPPPCSPRARPPPFRRPPFRPPPLRPLVARPLIRVLIFALLVACPAMFHLLHSAFFLFALLRFALLHVCGRMRRSVRVMRGSFRVALYFASEARRPSRWTSSDVCVSLRDSRPATCRVAAPVV
eukprot:3172118-Alexandrium_andersonii.AAC.1